jgi:AAA15 family ATPase/GTPase
MLNSLYIKNYRSLKELKLNTLDQVNLITGKNNTGKSTLLEAIAIYACKGDLLDIEQIIEQHGEIFQQNEKTQNEFSSIRVLSSIFSNRVIGFEPENQIIIGEIEKNLFGESPGAEGSIILKFVKYIDETEKDESGNLIKRRRIVQKKIENDNYKLGFSIAVKGITEHLYSLEDYNIRLLGYGDKTSTNNYQFIKTANIDRMVNGRLFDDIALTDKEKYVIEALRIIESATDRIAFVERRLKNSERVAVIKLKNSKDVFPLKSMGDGINRILTIILALVNSENGFLLIDEFENGLHYSVQEQLWKIIFSLSKELNIQVFATTHSEDCISGFEQILNDPKNSVTGRLIRMDSIDGIIKQTFFSSDELKIANAQDIELR